MDALPPLRSDALGCNISDFDSLGKDDRTLQRLVQSGELKVLDPATVAWSIKHHTLEVHSGGEAEVHIVSWHSPAGAGGGAACPIPDGTRVAIKLHRRPQADGRFRPIQDFTDWWNEVEHCPVVLRKEVNILQILRAAGFSSRLPPILGIVQHQGGTADQPLFGYAMPGYQYGSLATLLTSTCHRRVSESVFAGFFAPHRMAGEYHELLSLLHDIHKGTGDKTRPGGRRPGLMLQDISSGNVLVHEQADGSCRLLLSDPSMTGAIEHMPHPTGAGYFCSTWLWGSMTAKMKRFDPGADLFSLSFTFLEAWAVAEGIPVPLKELIQYIRADCNKSTGLDCARALCVEVLKRHMYCSTIQPRVQRELPGVKHMPGQRAAPPVPFEGMQRTFQGAVKDAQDTIGWAVVGQPPVDVHKQEADTCKALLLGIYQACQHTDLAVLQGLPPQLQRALQRAVGQVAGWAAPATAAARMPPEAALPAAAAAVVAAAPGSCQPSGQVASGRQAVGTQPGASSSGGSRSTGTTTRAALNAAASPLGVQQLHTQQHMASPSLKDRRLRGTSAAPAWASGAPAAATKAALLAAAASAAVGAASLAVGAEAATEAAAPGHIGMSPLRNQTLTPAAGRSVSAAAAKTAVPSSASKRRRTQMEQDQAGSDDESQPEPSHLKCSFIGELLFRFGPTRRCIVSGMDAFGLSSTLKFKRVYAIMVSKLADLFMTDVHQLLLGQEGPWVALHTACGMQPAELAALVGGQPSGHHYIEVSCSFASPDPSAFCSVAPVAVHGANRTTSSDGMLVTGRGGTAEQQEQYSTRLAEHIRSGKGHALGGGHGQVSVLFRISRQRLQGGVPAAPWVQHDWTLPEAVSEQMHIVSKTASQARS